MTAPTVAPSSDAVARPAPARLAASGGLVAVGALVASFVVLPADGGGTAASDIADRYAADGYLSAVVVQVAGVVAALVFAVGVADVLRTTGWPARLVTAGIGVAVALQLTGYAVIATLAAGTAERASGDVVLALYDLSSIAFTFASAGWAVALAGAATGILRTRAVARWVGWTAAIVAGVCAAATGALAPSGFLGVHGDLGFLAVVLVHGWLLVASVALLRRRRA